MVAPKQLFISQHDFDNKDSSKEKYLKQIKDGGIALDEGDRVYLYELKETFIYKTDLVPKKKAVDKKSKA